MRELILKERRDSDDIGEFDRGKGKYYHQFLSGKQAVSGAETVVIKEGEMKRKQGVALLLSAAMVFTMAAAILPPDAVKAESEGRATMYRLYNTNSGEHFYTKNASEKSDLVTAGWKDEGIGWIAPEMSNTPVYRLYNENVGDHHYTMKASERDDLITAGWNYEGVGWYSDDAKTVPLYREYNPNAVTGTHSYTTDKGEHDDLVKAGWKDEGIGWYGVNPYDSKYEPGDIVILGSYEQDNDLSNGAEPIEWQVVGTRDGHTLLISKYALDCKQYNEEWTDITWENCTLRSWLNNDFYNKAFSSFDKKWIVTAHNSNPDSYELYRPLNTSSYTYGAKGGNATNDKVFLLSWTEARDYFGGKLYDSDIGAGNYNQKLLCKPTAYAKAQGGWAYSNSDNYYPSDTDGCCWWWLRSPGNNQDSAALVRNYGALNYYFVHGSTGGVRPAILIN